VANPAAAVGAGLQLGQGIYSGVQGKQAEQRLARQINQQNEIFRGLLDRGTGILDQIGSNLGQFQNPVLMQDVTDAARNLTGNLTQNVQDAMARVGQGGGADLARSSIEGLNYDFGQVGSQLQQASDFARQMGDIARTRARDEAALAMQQGLAAIDSAMAARGFSRNSGAAAAGLAQLGTQQALARSQLEGQLAQQAGQLGLQAAQMDTQNQLALSQMASQFQLGRGQLGAQVGLDLQRLNDQNAWMGASLLNDAALSGFNALQSTYQQNYLLPQLQLTNVLGGLAGQLAGIATSGLAANTGIMARGAETAGSGKGAAIGTATDILRLAFPTKQQSTG